MRFEKYHALGNDYLVIDPAAGAGADPAAAPAAATLEAGQIRRICHRHYGIGSDGILFGPGRLPAGGEPFALKIYNPDGSEAEKSGNGLRIFSRYLFDRGRVGEAPFQIATAGGVVTARVAGDGREVTVEMGRVSFASEAIPVAGPVREVLREPLPLCHDGQRIELTVCAATVGNPHCVVLCEQSPDAALARRLGPLIETDARFPHRANVQFMQVLSRDRIRIEIWERGAGYTLASGSSSTAAAAVAHRLGLCDPAISVEMPGGTIAITLSAHFDATMTGAVTRVGSGWLAAEMFDG